MDIKSKITSISTAIALAGGITVYQGTLPLTPEDSIKPNEIVALRTENSEHIKMADGKINAHIYLSPINYKDGNTWKKIDTSIRAKSFLNFALSDRPYETTSGIYKAEYPADKAYNYKFSRKNASIEYEALFDTSKSVEINIQTTNSGIKETVVLLDNKAPQSLSWKLTVDGFIRTDGNGGWIVCNAQANDQFIIQPLTATDANGKIVPIRSELIKDTLTAVLDCKDAVFPVDVDPSTVIASKAALNGSAYEVLNTATYLDARNAAGNASGTDISIGQMRNATPTYGIWRSFLCFPSIPAMVSVSACTLYTDGASDHSTTDFNINIVGANAWKSVIETADFTRFNGWASSGAYTGTILNDEWSTSSYSANWNALIFNPAGKDSLLAATGDSLWIALLSSRDYDPTDPSGNEYIGFTSGASPYISFSYAVVYGNPPTDFTLSSPTTTSISASWTNHHTTGIDSLTIWSGLLGAETWFKLLNKTNTSTSLINLTPNTQYTFSARVDSSDVNGYSNKDTLYTLANPPNNWAFTEDLSDTTKITIGFGTNSNGITTQYAIRDSTNQKWIDASGAATDTKTWRTAAQWTATASLTGQHQNVKHIIGVQARNDDGIETTYIWGTMLINYHTDIFTLTNVVTNKTPWSGAYPDTRDYADSSGVKSAALDTIGQWRPEVLFYKNYRGYMRYGALPKLNAISSAKVILQGVDADSAASNFNLKLYWDSSPGRQDKARYYSFDAHTTDAAYVESPLNNLWQSNVDFHAGRDTLVFSPAGILKLITASLDTARFSIISHKDSANTAPTVAEYLVFNNTDPQIEITWAYLDSVPNAITVIPVSPDSIFVTWLNRSETAIRYRLVDAYTGIALGGNDSTASTETNKYYGGLAPNSKHNIAVKVIGGKVDGEVSTSQDSCYTWSAVLPAPIVTMITNATRKFVIDTTGIYNPNTKLAAQDSITRKFIRYISGAIDTLDATADSSSTDSAIWRKYSDWNGAAGDTFSFPIGHRSVLRLWTKSGE
jgi:hypothetical protein